MCRKGRDGDRELQRERQTERSMLAKVIRSFKINNRGSLSNPTHRNENTGSSSDVFKYEAESNILSYCWNRSLSVTLHHIKDLIASLFYFSMQKNCKKEKKEKSLKNDFLDPECLQQIKAGLHIELELFQLSCGCALRCIK